MRCSGAGSRYSLALAVKGIIAKYLDHLPLERQTQSFDCHGLIITSRVQSSIESLA